MVFSQPMPPARRSTNTTPTLQALDGVPDGPDPEFARVLRMADPGSALEGPLTFAPSPAAVVSAPDWLAAWHGWREDIFARRLVPAMLAAADHAERGQARELIALGASLHAALEPQASARSRQAGGRLLRRLGTARGERWIAKLLAADADGTALAHFPVIYAAQSSLFHLPLRLLLPGYAYWEWVTAAHAHPPTRGSLPPFADEAADLHRTNGQLLSSRDHAAPDPFAACGGA